jgi:hypothetical protein
MFERPIFTGLIISLVFVLCACSAEPTQDPVLIYTQAAQTVEAQLTGTALAKPADTATPTPIPTQLPTIAPTTTPVKVGLPTLPPLGTLPVLDATLQPTSLQPPGTGATPTTGILLPSALPTIQPTLPQPTATPKKSYSGDHATFQYQVPADGQTFAPGAEFLLSWGFLNDGTTTWNPDYRLVFFGGTVITNVSSVAGPASTPPGQKAEYNVWAKLPSEAGSYITRWKLVNPAGAYLTEVYFAFKISP